MPQRLKPHGIQPSTTNGEVLKTVAGVTAWAADSPTGITVQDENSNVATGVTQIDFQGALVSAAPGSGEVVVTIAESAWRLEFVVTTNSSGDFVDVWTDEGLHLYAEVPA